MSFVQLEYPCGERKEEGDLKEVVEGAVSVGVGTGGRVQ